MQTLGVYIQFPFCASKCSFCNFSSRVEPKLAYGPYVRALEREMDLLERGLAFTGISGDCLSFVVDSVYCGGGTPSLAGADGLAAMFLPLRRKFHIQANAEWTLEITPGSADRNLLRVALQLGVNRLSIGAQSFVDCELSAVGRLHDAADTREQVATARQAGFCNLSLDLVAGLPYQTAATWQATLNSALRLRPDHISVYLFEADEHSRLGREVLHGSRRYHANTIPDDEFLAGAYERARELLAQAGYLQYEISNFALPGRESHHNRKYWQLDPYIGLGAGAHSYDGAHRWSNEVEPRRYQERLLKNELPIAEVKLLSPSDQVEEFFFLGLRQRQGVSIEDVRSRWSKPSLNWWEDRVRQLQEDGFLKEDRGRVCLDENAYLVSNEIFERFLM